MIFEEGQSANSLFVILHGSVSFSSKNKGVINILNSGDIFGEMGIILSNNRSATATTLSEFVVVLEIFKDDLNLILGKEPRISFFIMKNMAAELADRYLIINRENFSVRSVFAPQVKNIAMREEDGRKNIKISVSKINNEQVTHLKISNISNGILFSNEGKNIVRTDEMIPLKGKNLNLTFEPSNPGCKKYWFDVQQSTDGTTVKQATETSRVYIFTY